MKAACIDSGGHWWQKREGWLGGGQRQDNYDRKGQVQKEEQSQKIGQGKGQWYFRIQHEYLLEQIR